MNPYDFVPIDWNNLPERHPPSPHDRFDGVSGRIEGTITAKTPIFIFHSPKKNREGEAEPFINDNQGQHIIPGSSLKGLFRNLVETIHNGCFLLFDGNYKEDDRDRQRRLNYRRKLLNRFKKCGTANLCIACRMFGRIPDTNDNSNLHLGNVSFNDAVEVKLCEHQAVYTIALMEPKPRHQAFYLEPSGQRKRIAGRKFYFHQPGGIQTESTGSDYNQHIKPIDKGSQFAFSVQFTNLEPIELQTLLYALNLEQDMHHKLGYGKPAGLGSVHFDITRLTLINYTNRYKVNQGAAVYAVQKLGTYLSTETLKFTTDKKSSTLNALRRIWRWDPNSTTAYRYPNQAWFNENPITPISGTL